jgi:DNA primase
MNAESIKQQLNPLDFYSHELRHAKLNKSGWNVAGICPFHADRKPGSFFVNLDTGAFKCFSCGSFGGDIISFTMAVHELDFVEALAKIANDWGLL